MTNSNKPTEAEIQTLIEEGLIFTTIWSNHLEEFLGYCPVYGEIISMDGQLYTVQDDYGDDTELSPIW